MIFLFNFFNGLVYLTYCFFVVDLEKVFEKETCINEAISSAVAEDKRDSF